MPIKIITGNIFTSNCQTIVNTINCVGVMGAGIAFECRLRHPEMFEKYTLLCKSNQIKIGNLWIYKSNIMVHGINRWILNFPTKKDWKDKSKIEYLRDGLEKFVATYKDKGINSIAFPLLGADKGGIPQEDSLKIMRHYLDHLDIEIEIYRYDPKAPDDLFNETKFWLFENSIDQISKCSGIQKNYTQRLVDALQDPSIVQLNQLARVKGIGFKTLEKVFKAATQINQETGEMTVTQQKALF